MPGTSSGIYGTGLLPWQVDPVRVLCEALADDGLLVVSGTGNMSDLICDATQAQGPSTLAVGGVALSPEDAGDWRIAPAHACSRGTLFDGKWVPDLLAPAENLVLPLLGDEAARARVYDGPDYGAVPEGYIRTNGTSFAGPAVLGAAACVWQAHPGWSAAQVRTALVASARHRPQWEPLRAGLVSVAAAVGLAPPTPPAEAPQAYRRYEAWRTRPENDRAGAGADLASSDPDAAAEAVLSLLPDQVAGFGDSAIQRLREPLDRTPSAVEAAPRLAAALLCVLAHQPEQLTVTHLAAGIRHPDARVRGAALFALERARDHWDGCAPLVERAFSDESLVVRFAALKLAATVRDARWLLSLLAGLDDDVAQRRLANYAARRNALTAITGTTIEEQPP